MQITADARTELINARTRPTRAVRANRLDTGELRTLTDLGLITADNGRTVLTPHGIAAAGTLAARPAPENAKTRRAEVAAARVARARRAEARAGARTQLFG